MCLALPSSDPLSVPSLRVGRVTNLAMKYQVKRTNTITDAVITGHEVFRFGVPMIGEYDNKYRANTWKTVTISPAVPGAQYRITTWALTGTGRRSGTPAVVYATTGEASECDIHILYTHIYNCYSNCVTSCCAPFMFPTHVIYRDILDFVHTCMFGTQLL